MDPAFGTVAIPPRTFAADGPQPSSGAALLTLLGATIVLWSFAEASVWWVAPDIAICIAYAHAPRHWRRFLLLGLAGALLGSAFTYVWAQHDGAGWAQTVAAMRFHTAQNLERAATGLARSPWSIVLGAWQGIPYKLFFGAAGQEGLAFWPLACWGLASRAVRFSFSLIVTVGLRHWARSWAVPRPWAFSALLMAIWCAMILLFDVAINGRTGPAETTMAPLAVGWTGRRD